MAYPRIKFLVLVTLITMILVIPCGEKHDLESTFLVPAKNSEPADETQSFSFTLSDWDYRIIESAYSAAHLNEHFTYRISFTLTGESLEFFICIAPEASTWAHGGMIIIDSDKHWGSTDGVTATYGFSSNVALAFVFNHEGSGSSSVSGSITVDTSGPIVTSSLIPFGIYNGTVRITATATDTVSEIDIIWFYIDNDRQFGMETENFWEDWDTTKHSNGNHTITFLAIDEAGYSTNVTYPVQVQNTLLGNLGILLPIGIAVAIIVPVVYFFKSGRTISWERPDPQSFHPPELE